VGRAAPALALHGDRSTVSREVIELGYPWYAGKTFSPAVRAGNLLFISGLDARDQRTGKMIPGDIAEQCEVIYRAMGEILEAAGGSMADVVMTTDFVTDATDYMKTEAVRRKYLGPEFPAATGVIVNGLLGRGALIEIAAVAVLRDR
jgi:aminoacrylate peracid reductase